MNSMDTKKRKQANRKLYEKRLLEAMFPITSLTRTDLMNKEVGFTKKQALQVSDEEMRRIAGKMADDYCGQLYWPSLKVRATLIIDTSITIPNSSIRHNND